MILLSVMVLLTVALFTLLERKILGLSHFRVGPSKVMLKGFLQPFADALKLICKSDSFLLWSNHVIFYLTPVFMIIISLICWIVFPFLENLMNFEFSFLMVLVLIGLNIYGLLFSSWASNSKYSSIGGMRAVSQALSYEVLLSFGVLLLMKSSGGYSMSDYFEKPFSFFLMMNPVVSILLMLSLVVELNRTPFDLAEGESELVSGFCVEYGGMQYTMVFLGENIFVMFSSFFICSTILCKNPGFLFSILWILVSIVLVIIRSAMPRVRYDTLVKSCWLCLLPLMLVMYMVSFLQDTL